MLVGEAGELCKMVLSPLCRSLRYAGRETCTRMQPAAGRSVATRLSVCLCCVHVPDVYPCLVLQVRVSEQ